MSINGKLYFFPRKRHGIFACIKQNEICPLHAPFSIWQAGIIRFSYWERVPQKFMDNANATFNQRFPLVIFHYLNEFHEQHLSISDFHRNTANRLPYSRNNEGNLQCEPLRCSGTTSQAIEISIWWNTRGWHSICTDCHQSQYCQCFRHSGGQFVWAGDY